MKVIGNTGLHDGFGWYRIEGAVAENKRKYAPGGMDGNKGRDVIALCAPGSIPEGTLLQVMLKTDHYHGSYIGDNLGFQPFDTATAFEGAIVCYDTIRFNSFDINAWMQERLEIPDGIDVSFELDTYGRKLYACARTNKNGRTTSIRRKVASDIHYKDALAPILAYFKRNCPAPAIDEPKVTGGSHVMEILTHLDGPGHDLVGRWLERARVGRNIEALVIPGNLLDEGMGIGQINLAMSGTSNAALAVIKMDEGHTVTDDDLGTNIDLAKTTLPQILKAALKGRSVGEVVDLPWTRGLEIRSVKDIDGGVRLRAMAPGVDLELGTRPPDDEARSISQLRAMQISDIDLWDKVEEPVYSLLSSMTPTQMATILGLLRNRIDVDLTPYGCKGTIIKSLGTTIVAKEVPTRAFKDMLDEALSRQTPDRGNGTQIHP